ncbi:MAG: NAD(P)/FAD-dependent oxidoreductase [Asgard group archaeon]|nr:NAD(P)/FAD-dependent oxidoreductase [Asgard group archaeon]
MTQRKIIIIGAGIAGLTAGCYLQKHGFETEIYELHNLPGGCVTSWKRKDYTIDGSIHGLVGSSPDHPMYDLWDEIIDMKNLEIFDGEEVVIITRDKKRFIKYYNLEKLEKYMKEISPEDSPIIEDYIKDIRKLQKMDAFSIIAGKPMEFYNIFDYLKMVKLLPALKIMQKWQKITAEEFSKMFKHPFIKEAVRSFLSPVLFEILVFTEMDLKRSGFPVGGSLNFSKQFERRYLELGGKIHYKSKVTKINTTYDEKNKKDKVTGITLENREYISTDIVISAMDGYSTLFELLDGQYLYEKLSKVYNKADLNPSMILISVGVNKEYKDESQTFFINLEKPFKTPDGNVFDLLKLRIFNFETPLVPVGKTLFIVELSTRNFEYWRELRAKNRVEYKKIKTEIASQIIDMLNDHFENLKENVDMIDVATPATFHRYTNNWQGSTQGWANENLFENKPIKKELPNLANFFMIGHWTVPGGGVPNAFMSGRTVAQIICKQEKKKF